MQRCGWVTQDPLYLAYHDNEWGVPQTDKRALFEMICLEGQQAGLSWITVLKKRENYRRAFHEFDPQAVALMDEADMLRLLQDSGLIRHRGKLEAIINNAKAMLALEAEGEDFSALSGHSSIISRFCTVSPITSWRPPPPSLPSRSLRR
jgi:DNA-3-methyladenine glycosylase I (EC 3.2.2.20)